MKNMLLIIGYNDNYISEDQTNMEMDETNTIKCAKQTSKKNLKENLQM